ncbi:primase-helicase family protein [Burkholderia multivorans]|uniref:primase-helicase family protein n=1 Tax=Burkholderia multivorans TaxID=87883 RepID=UPI001C23759B|nr:primase-helicase family protein [Burkholderia multivorans]MBU9553871.1 hypothetical protein [Burkholderia multivorans]
MNNNNDKYSHVNISVVLNSAENEYNAEYVSCDSEKDKTKFEKWCKEYFNDHIFIRSVSGKPVVLSPYSDFEEYTDEEGNVCKREITKYEYSTIRDFCDSKRDHKYETKKINKNTQKQEYKKNSFADFWLDTESDIKRSYKRLTFDANPNFNNPELFNMWNGFVEEKKGSVEPFLNHLHKLIGNKEYEDHIIKTLAWVVRFPHKNPGITIVLMGEQGCGKTTISMTLKAICPDHSKVVSDLSRDLLGEFNGDYLHVKFFLHEESSFAGDKKTASKLKDIITSEHRTTKLKFLNGVETKNIGFHIFTSNSETPVNVENSDRRHNIFKCSSELIGNRKHFNEYYRWLNFEGKHALMYYFKNEVDLDGFDVRNTIDTDAKTIVKQNNFEGVDKFLYDLLCGEGEFYDVMEGDELSSQTWIHSEIEVSRQELYERYKIYCKEHTPKALLDSSQVKFTLALAKIFRFPEKYKDNWKRKNKPPFFRIPVRYIARQYFASHAKSPNLFGISDEEKEKKEAEALRKEYEANKKSGMFDSPKKEFPAEQKIEVPKHMPKFGKKGENYD